MFDHFSLIAPLYEWLIPVPDVERIIRLLELPVPGKLLDAGGGTGRVAGQLRPYVDELILTDASGGMLKQAQKKNALTVTMAHAERLPFGGDSFERILVVDALHHFHDQRAAVADLIRVLKPGGLLVIEEPDLGHFKTKLVALGEKLAFMRSHFFHPEQIAAMAAEHGLRADIERDNIVNAWISVRK